MDDVSIGASATQTSDVTSWYKDAIIYQLHIKSF